MTTKKNEKKPAVAKDETTKKEESSIKVKTADGKEVTLKDGDIVRADKDGTYKFCGSEDILKADSIVVNVGTKTKEDGTVDARSYSIHIKKCDNGNIVLVFDTADGMDTVDKNVGAEGEPTIGNTVRLIGRGQNIEAMFAAQFCWEGYARNFGISKSYSLVRLELDKTCKVWTALFVPVINVMG